VDAMSELVTNLYICIFCGWEVMSASPMRLDAPLTVRGVVVDTIPGGVNQERLRARLGLYRSSGGERD